MTLSWWPCHKIVSVTLHYITSASEKQWTLVPRTSYSKVMNFLSSLQTKSRKMRCQLFVVWVAANGEHWLDKYGIGEYGIGELGMGEYGIGEHGIGKHGIIEHGIGKHGIIELGIGKYGIGEHGIGEHGKGEHGIGEMLRHLLKR